MADNINKLRNNINETCDIFHSVIKPLFITNNVKLDPALFNIIKGFLSIYSDDKLVTDYIYFTYEYWEMIDQKNITFFLEHAHKIFSDLPIPINKEHIDEIRFIFHNNLIKAEDLEDLWKFFSAHIILILRIIGKDFGGYQYLTLTKEIRGIEEKIEKYQQIFHNDYMKKFS